MAKVSVGISAGEERLEVRFSYNRKDVQAVKRVAGHRWSDKQTAWFVPANLETARELRKLFGARMELTTTCRQWAHRLVRQERKRRKLHVASDASLASTPDLILDAISGKPLDLDLPPRHPFGRQRDARPYQRADIKLMSLDNVMNCNDVGTGKTLEAIGAIYEAGIYPSSGVVVAPRRTLIPVWKRTFEWFTDYEFDTSESPTERQRYLTYFATARPEKTVIGLIADDLRLVKYCTRKNRDEWLKKSKGKKHKLHAHQDYKGNWYRFKDNTQRLLMQGSLGFFIIDEFHNTGLNNRLSQFFQGARLLSSICDRTWPMSATPMGGKAERLWPILHLMYPKVYTSFWNWVGPWIETEEEEFYRKGDKGGLPSGRSQKLKGLKPGIEEEFYNAHRQHMTRRRKREALPGLPPMVEIPVETPMTKKQRAQYDAFEEDHEIIIGKKRLAGNVVLSQYTRLRQMANARLEWDKFFTKPIATHDSGKIEWLLEALDENGIRPHLRGQDKNEPEPRARAYVGVLDVSFAEIITQEIRSYGVRADSLTGKTKPEDFARIIAHFEGNDEEPYVIIMTMQTGGSGLDLQQANSAHALDDPWDPDITYQFFGRGDRGSRETALKCYSYITPNSIQEYVRRVAGDKKITNDNILNYVADIESLRKNK